MVRKNLWVFGLCLLFAGVVGTVGTAALSADFSISDREASQVWGGQYCMAQYAVEQGCDANFCPTCNSYVGGGNISCGPTLASFNCVANKPTCGVKYVCSCTQ